MVRKWNAEGNLLDAYKADLQREFARYGHTATPLTDAQIERLWSRDIGADKAYAIGCDVACGFSFAAAMRANTEA
jgi:hypothetical protein